MTILPALDIAYRGTAYRVAASPPFVLGIGSTSPALLSLYRQTQASSAAFITACNPASQPLETSENARRQAMLARDLDAMQLAYVEGVGQHPDGTWPAEPSYLVLGLTLAQACDLGRRFGQNAIVWCGPQAVPELVWLS